MADKVILYSCIDGETTLQNVADRLQEMSGDVLKTKPEDITGGEPDFRVFEVVINFTDTRIKDYIPNG